MLRWDTWGRLIASHTSTFPWAVIEGNHEEEVYSCSPQLTPIEAMPESEALYGSRLCTVHRTSNSQSNRVRSYERSSSCVKKGAFAGEGGEWKDRLPGV